jgi:hypothetical protein
MVFLPDSKTVIMKGSRSQTNMQNKHMVTHRPVPPTRDELDSRKNEEQDTKGNDVTHNKKQTKSDRKKVKND